MKSKLLVGLLTVVALLATCIADEQSLEDAAEKPDEDNYESEVSEDNLEDDNESKESEDDLDGQRNDPFLWNQRRRRHVSRYQPTDRASISKGRPTRQSSIAADGKPNRAVDGNRNSNYGGKSCTHTRNQHGAWWRVDLGRSYPILSVIISNRGDCCWNRLSNFDIRVGNIDNSNANSLCYRQHGAMGKGQVRRFTCQRRVSGRFVYIKLNGKNPLTLCEVEVIPDKRRVNGGYSTWSNYAPCSKTCGGGMRSRTRKCNNPPPMNGGRGCSGSGNAIERTPCNRQNCPKSYISGIPVVSYKVENKEVKLVVEFKAGDIAGSNVMYMVSWFDSITTGPMEITHGSRTRYTLSKKFKHGSTLYCNVNGYNKDAPNNKGAAVVSNKMYVGIKVTPSNLRISESEKPVKLTITATIPILQGTVAVSLVQNNKQIVISKCLVVFAVSHSSQFYVVWVYARRDFINDGNHQTTITLTVLPGRGSIGWINHFQLSACQVTIIDIHTSNCGASGDPHVVTFDKTKYDHYRLGDYVLTKSKARKFEVNIRTFKCWRAVCTCALAAREDNDVLVVDFCRRSTPTVRLASSVRMAKGTRFTRSKNGKSYYMTFPSGTSVRFDIFSSGHYWSRVTYGNIQVNVPSDDFRESQGLCGSFEGRRNQDLKGRNGQKYRVERHPNSFIDNWQIPAGRSLFYYNDRNKPCYQEYPDHYCYCIKRGNSAISQCRPEPAIDQAFIQKRLRGFRDLHFYRQRKCMPKPTQKPPTTMPYFEPMKRKRRSIESEDEHYYLYNPTQLKNVNIKWPTPSGKTEAVVRRHCETAIKSNPTGKKCAAIKGFDFSAFIGNCIEDTKIIDKYEISVPPAVTAMQRSCEAVAAASGNTKLVASIGQTICPNQCSGHGVCNRGKCSCRGSYISDDCSVDGSKPPHIDVATHQFCDIRKKCASVSLMVSNFYASSSLTCKITNKYGRSRKVQGKMLNLYKIECPLANVKAMRTDKIAVSNDGKTFSKSVAVTIYDSKCHDCIGRTKCIIKKNTCWVRKSNCYKAGEKSSSARCLVCKPRRGAYARTLKRNLALPGCRIVDGRFTAWKASSKCTKTCGGGHKQFTRTCTHPAPENGGKKCVGKTKITKVCNKQSCPAPDTCKTHRTTDGKCCIFPFIFRGVSYNECTIQGHLIAWCALTSNYDEDHKWGKCKDLIIPIKK